MVFHIFLKGTFEQTIKFLWDELMKTVEGDYGTIKLKDFEFLDSNYETVEDSCFASGKSSQIQIEFISRLAMNKFPSSLAFPVSLE